MIAQEIGRILLYVFTVGSMALGVLLALGAVGFAVLAVVKRSFTDACMSLLGASGSHALFFYYPKITPAFTTGLARSRA